MDTAKKWTCDGCGGHTRQRAAVWSHNGFLWYLGENPDARFRCCGKDCSDAVGLTISKFLDAVLANKQLRAIAEEHPLQPVAVTRGGN